MLLQPLFSFLYLPDYWSERPTTVNSVRPDELNLPSNKSGTGGDIDVWI